MNRSSVRKNTRKTKDRQRNVNIHSNPIIAANWDKSLTLQQNYKRLQLRSKLGTFAGGTEKEVVTLSKKRADKANADNERRPSISTIEQTDDPSKIPEGEARMIRDPETNEVIKIIYGTMKVSTDKSGKEYKSEVIEKLEEYARNNAKIKKERKPSERESEWLQSLYEKYKDDYSKMFWDKKLNVYQQSAGELKKRILKWKAANNIV